MKIYNKLLFEGIFRKPRLKTNDVLKKYSHLFSGEIINVSGSSDSDKECSLYDYYFGNYDSGNNYKDYFINSNSYTISNYPNDTTKFQLDNQKMIFLDLEKELSSELKQKYDVVYCHTVFEHIFDIFKSFENLCNLSKDVVIFIVPQFQMIHDFDRGYKDYWRFTPFSVDKLFEINNFKVLYRETTYGLSESMYLFYIATKNKNKWNNIFPKLEPLKVYINDKNNGINYTRISKVIIKIDQIIRTLIRILKLKTK